VLESGRFAVSWGEHARRIGVEVEVLKGDMRRAVRPAEVEARLKADRKANGGGTIKAVLVAQIDTASGVVNDIAAIGQAMRAAGHDALLMVDAVASLGCMPFEMDAWRVDVAMSGSQKGLMTPPGLGFVAANDRAREVHKKAGLRTPYWDWTEREGDLHYQKYAGTPPEHLLFGLRKAFDMLLEEGFEKVFRRHQLLAEAVRRAVGVWAEGQAISFNIVEPSERSDTVTAVLLAGHDPEALRAYCNDKCGVVLGHGIGELSGKAFRIAHMGHVNAPMVLGTLSVIEVGLAALDIPHGRGGAQAAIDWLGEQVKA
jgi:alanine-glyoxylate transaminase/serine-glyoxylate transaminase/serine-pyruvate transaminase